MQDGPPKSDYYSLVGRNDTKVENYWYRLLELISKNTKCYDHLVDSTQDCKFKVQFSPKIHCTILKKIIVTELDCMYSQT